jgi:hypothetical protein
LLNFWHEAVFSRWSSWRAKMGRWLCCSFSFELPKIWAKRTDDGKREIILKPYAKVRSGSSIATLYANL